MEDKLRVLKNTGWMIFDKVFILLLNLLVTVRIANHFGSTEYGAYQYAVSIVAIIEILVTFVDGRVLKKMYLNSKAGSVVYTATVSRLLFSGLSAAIGVIFILCYDAEPYFKLLFTLLLINAVVTDLRFGMANRFEYQLMSKMVVIASDISTLIGSLLQLLAVSLDMSIVSISVIAIISSSINLVIVFIQYKQEFGRLDQEEEAKFEPAFLKSMVKESLPLAIAASCATIYTRCDSVMLGAMLTTAEVGIYSIAIKLINVVQIPLAPIRESVYPDLVRLYSTDKRRYGQKYIEISSLLTWIYIVGVGLSFVVLPYLFQFLSEDYAEAFPVYRVYVLGTFFMYNAGLRAGHFTLINKGKILAYSQTVAVIANVIINYVLITIFGMYGAAFATVVTQCISLMLSNLFFAEGREVFVWQLKSINPVYAIKAIKKLIGGGYRDSLTIIKNPTNFCNISSLTHMSVSVWRWQYE